MNVNMGSSYVDNHKTAHLFGLDDRYNYVQQIQGDKITTQSKTVCMFLPENEDPEYYNHENDNLMGGNGNVLTQKQWGYIFNKKPEKTNQVTMLISGLFYKGQDAFGVSKDGKTLISIENGERKDFKISTLTYYFMNPKTGFKAGGKGESKIDEYFFGNYVLPSKMQQNLINISTPYEGGN